MDAVRFPGRRRFDRLRVLLAAALTLAPLAAALLAASSGALGQTLACKPRLPRTDPGAGFAPFGPAEQALARGGNAGPAWEWALGADTDSEAKVQGSVDWVSGRSYAWTLSYAGSGAAALEVRDGAALLLRLDYGSGMEAGNALELQVATTAGVGSDTTISAAITALRGHAVSASISQTGNRQEAVQRLYFYHPDMSQGFSASGTVSLSYARLPAGSRVNFRARAGTLPCTNAAPTVSMSEPAAGALLQAGSVVKVSANASDADGTIAEVEFFANGVLIGSASSAPYSIAWTPTAGAASLTAIATDNAGDRTTSDAATVTVNAQPSVSLTSPAPGTVVHAPGSVTLSATASDPDGKVNNVEFFRDGSLIATASAAPYSLLVADLPAGVYSFSARASDDRGGTATSTSVSVLVNAPPTVTLTRPAPDAALTAPANIGISAEAADVDGTIASVSFYQGATLITTLSAPPYSFTWANVPAGTYSLTAQATDNHGATVSSNALDITVSAAMAQLYFIHVDHLDTPRLVADAAGTTVWKWDQQEPFGDDVADENPSGFGAFDFPLRLPGQYFDKETNRHYNYFRDYDPRIGRYVESDPIGLWGGLNTFVYVYADPTRLGDPLGLAVWICTRAARGMPGNHTYLWDDRGRGRSCGTGGMFGFGPRGEGEPGRLEHACKLVPGSGGAEDRIMNCCYANANNGLWFPYLNDCYNAAYDCVEAAGVKNPGAPAGRLSDQCSSCMPRPDDNFLINAP